MTDEVIYYLYNKYTYRFVTISTYPMDTKRIGHTATPIPEDDNRLYRFYIYNPDTDTWEFQLDEFRRDRLAYVSQKYKSYIESKLTYAESLLVVFTTALTKIAIDVNPSLEESDYTQLTTHIHNVISILDWLNQVNSYFRNITETIQTSSKEDIINTINSLNFNQFDHLVVDIDFNSVVEKIKTLLS